MEQNKFRQFYFKNIIDQILDQIVNNVNNRQVQEKIQKKILDPMIDYIGKRLYPYILMISGCFVSLILLLIFMISTK